MFHFASPASPLQGRTAPNAISLFPPSHTWPRGRQEKRTWDSENIWQPQDAGEEGPLLPPPPSTGPVDSAQPRTPLASSSPTPWPQPTAQLGQLEWAEDSQRAGVGSRRPAQPLGGGGRREDVLEWESQESGGPLATPTARHYFSGGGLCGPPPPNNTRPVGLGVGDTHT